MVIEYVEEDRHSLALAAVPELCYLVHGGKVERLENRSSAACAVAAVCDNNALLAVAALIERRAERDRCTAADYCVVRHNTERNKECVHRAAETAVKAGSSCKYLCKRTVEQEVNRKLLDVAACVHVLLNDVQHRSAEKFLHYVVQLAVLELVYRGQTLGKYLAVAAVRAECQVVYIKRVSLTDGRSLLSDGEVSGTGVVVCNAVVLALGLDLVEHRLELADDAHIAVDAEKIVLFIELFLLCKRLFVLAYRNILEVDITGGKRLFGVNEL